MTEILETAVKIRAFETSLFDLYKQGVLAGTMHTCLGQELCAATILSFAEKEDFVTSNHRGHGHYLAKTGDYFGLLAEIMGKQQGVCKGYGGTQHLAADNFLANGIQGGMLPTAVGLAWAKKIKKESSMVLSFIGDGTFGEGIVYESLNIAALQKVPLLIVVENNHIAQSTPATQNLAGDIQSRAMAFNLKVFSTTTLDFENLQKSSKAAIDFVKKERAPAVLVVETQRLGPHSKGDDTRDAKEVEHLWNQDLLRKKIQDTPSLAKTYETLIAEIEKWSKELQQQSNSLRLEKKTELKGVSWRSYSGPVDGYWGTVYGDAYAKAAQQNQDLIFFGEDVAGAYGGAFKVSKKMAAEVPERVFNMPISEAAIAGISIGLSIGGLKPFAEIMFGDFLTLAADQILNHAAKFQQLYSSQFNVSPVIRAPMGGYRGYGATHSQSLEKMFLGWPGLKVIAPSLLTLPNPLVQALLKNRSYPVLLIENKSTYSERPSDLDLTSFEITVTEDEYPVYQLNPLSQTCQGALICYGGMVSKCVQAANALFEKKDLVVKVIVVTELGFNSFTAVKEALRNVNQAVFVEEGYSFGSLSSEMAVYLHKEIPNLKYDRLGALEQALPAALELEAEVLPSMQKIVDLFTERFGDL